MNELKYYLVAALTLGFAAFAQPSHALDQAEFNKLMDGYLSADGNVEKVGTALERYFTKRREEQQQQQQKDESQLLEEQFKNPVKIDVGNSPFRGNKNAKVTVIEFSDFECPFCKRGAEVMDQLVEAYPNDVKVVFKHLPLPFHQNAKPASRAAMAAGEQGKFWEMHDEIFKHQDKLNEAGFLEMAKNIGLDVEKFKNDLKNKAAEYDKQIDADMKIANDLGVRGTPGFFVNGVQVRGARPLPYFKTLVDRWLAEKKG